MNAIRSAAVAGVFNNCDPIRLAATVDNLLAQYPAATSKWPKAVIIEATLLKTSSGHLPAPPSRLSEAGASFVTININNQLRGRIGCLFAARPLIDDVRHNATAAAFHDPRFPALTLEEGYKTELHISMLTTPFPLNVDPRSALINCLTPEIDGVILEENGRRATHLPSVWQRLPDPVQFVTQLRMKAGLTGDGWTDQSRVHLYQTEEIC